MPMLSLSPIQILRQAVIEMQNILDSVAISSIYRTAPMYVIEQNDFYNMALTGIYDCGAGTLAAGAHKLLNAIHAIEARYGRDRNKEIVKGPRTLDIDIVLFGDETIDDDDLKIPHKGMWERPFVLIPALEVMESISIDSRNGTDREERRVTNAARIWTGAMTEQMKVSLKKCTQRVEKVK